LLSRGRDDLGAQPHLALQQLYVELLQQLLLSLTLLGLETHEASVELTFLLFGYISQGLHSSAAHLVHIFGHHRGPLGFLYKRNLSYDNCSRFAFH
jgi:hypothetical protein